VKIDLPKILLDLRAEVVSRRKDPSELRAFRMFSWIMRHPRAYARFGKLLRFGARTTPGAAKMFAPLKAWLSQRDLPPMPERSFRELWRERNAGRKA
jgi:L-lactate dehydrogenase complex protein LldF